MPPEQEEEDPITPLKRKKRILKTQLTKNKLLLTSYLCASEKDSDQIRTSVDTVLRAQEEVIDILLQLCDLNEEFEQELDFIQSDPNTTDLLSKATSYFAISNVATSQEVINPEPTPEQNNTSTSEDGNENPTDAVPTSADAGMVSPPTPSPNSHLPQLNYDMVQQLHRVSIPKFNGNKREYPLFRDAFMECVDKTLTSKSYKMLQLRQHLEQDALNAIEGFPASDIGYDSAIGRLDEKYGGPCRAVLIHLDAIRQMKGVNFNDLKTLEKFVDKLELCIISLKENGRKEEFEANSMFFCVARSKVPPDNVTQFKRWAAMQNFDETLVNLHTWLANEVRYRVEAREEVDGFNYGSASSSSSSSKHKYKYPHSDHRTKTYATNTNTQCPICNTAHSTGIVNCPVFRSFGIHDRWSVARDRRLCYRCLSPNHQGYKCNSSQRCWINGCPKSHHFLLHGGGSENPALNSCQPRNYERYEQRPNEATSLKQPVDYRSKHESRTHTQTNNCDCIAMRIAPVILCNGNRKRHANALLDECSSDTYIDDLLAADLGLVGIPISLNVGVVGGSKKLLHTTEVTINLSSYDYSTNLNINAFTVRDVTGDMTAYDWSANCHNWPHLKDIPFPRVVAGTKVDLLIGLNALELHRSITEIGGQIGEPVARLTPLGWTCMGPIPVQQRTQSGCGYSFARAFFIRETDSVDDILRNMWQVESGGLSGKLQFLPSDKQAIETTNNSLCQVDNRYRVGIPWKPGEPELHNNYSAAESRLLNLEKSLSRRPTVASEYRRIIDDQIRKGYISEVTKDPYNPDSYFLPHFAVVRWDKLTTKVRVVMDGAARCQGKSLNDCINPGPKLQRDLFDVLLRFRSNQIALVADITEMFLQIEIEPKDRQYHRFLWRDLDFQSPIKIYEYKRLVFGNSSSPYLSQAVIREHCLSNIDKYPIGANSILNSMYIDDLLDSVNDTSKAIQLRREISSLLMDAGFAIKKWLSNDPKVLEDIPVCDRVNQFAFDDDSLPSVKTLGVLWKADSDLFTFQVQRPEAVILTKRLVVSRASTLFDPLSFLSPFTVRAKIGIQKTWIQGLHWDDELPDDLIKPWEKWFEELPELSQVKVQRCLLKTDSKVKSKSIHTFVDASELAYASACYLRSEYEDGSVSVILVVAKTRVAPLKTISIPKLELCGAILGVRLTTTVCEVLNISKSNITYWCDSQNVLYWLKGQSRNYKPFVSHRVGEIHENSDPNQWRWIPTKLNSADLATRGISVSELVASDLWWHGPEFLLLENEHWPQSIISDPPEALEEERSNRTATFVTNPVIKELGRLNPSRYSSWTKLLRISAWVFRFINNCRTPQQRNNSPTLESNELHNSETFWIMHAQQEVFADDINELMKNNRVRNDSKLLCLNPCLDESGILRVKGRLDSAEHLSYETKTPSYLTFKA